MDITTKVFRETIGENQDAEQIIGLMEEFADFIKLNGFRCHKDQNVWHCNGVSLSYTKREMIKEFLYRRSV